MVQVLASKQPFIFGKTGGSRPDDTTTEVRMAEKSDQ